jgi:glycosyltransferase involved in cell wall biosynthesis
MHIVLIIPRFFPLWGGTEIRIKRVAEALLAKGFTFSVLTRRFNKTLSVEELMPGIKVYRFSKLRPFFYHAAQKWINENHETIDLIHTFRMDKMGIVGAWANAKFGIPHITDIITNEANLMLDSPSGQKKWAQIASHVDAIHCLSKGMAEFIRKNGISGEKIWYRPNAVDTEQFKPASGKDSLSSAFITVLCCGRIERQKGTDILIQAWRSLPSEISGKAKLVLVGSGKWEKMLRKEAADLPNIIFAGSLGRDKMLDSYQNAQIYVQPSRFEGMSNAMLEALASGLPIIATDIDGSNDLVQSGVNGLLIPVEDINALSSALIQLIKDADLRKDMGEASRKMAQRFSFQSLFLDFEKQYRTLIKST